MDNAEAVLGLALWVLIIHLLIKWHRWSKRYLAEHPEVTDKRINKNSPKWEQDEPLPECFDDMDTEREDWWYDDE